MNDYELNQKYGNKIKATCPWCGNDGELHITNTASIFVRCKKCKAHHPYGVSHYVNTIDQEELDLYVNRALNFWNKERNNG